MKDRLIKPKLRCRLLNLCVYKSQHICNYSKYNWTLLQITFYLLERTTFIASLLFDHSNHKKKKKKKKVQKFYKRDNKGNFHFPVRNFVITACNNL